MKVKGCDQVSVLPLESLEIGRKPIRPLADDGVPRFEIPDETRSMSKRHAVLRVLENGSATLRDMRSTNGTYLVRADGQLIRIPEGVDFPLPSAAVRMQFGDVPIDFVQVEETAEPAPAAVTDLFEYATDDGKASEPDVADMSVDDILDLRAGEPTSAFAAGSVTHRASELKAAALQSFTPMVAPVDDPNRPEAIANPVPLHVEHPKTTEPRDLFVDAMSNVLDGPMPQTKAPETAPAAEPDSAEPDAAESTRPVETRQPVADTVSAIDFIVANQARMAAVMQSRNAGQSVESKQQTGSVEPVQSEPTQVGPSPVEPTATEPASVEPVAEEPSPVEPQAERSAEPQSVEPQPDLSETAAYTPVFEPGSVFERVAKGEFRKPEPTIEVAGLTSDEAKRTDDYTMQFNMAGHPELLPFLAMNPGLYDDLYAWLAARGDADIDAALDNNPGYQEYRHAVGK